MRRGKTFCIITDTMQPNQLFCIYKKWLVLMVLLGTRTGSVWLHAAAASYSAVGDVTYKESWCSHHQYEVESEYQQVLEKLLADLTSTVAGDLEELWVVSDYGLFARAQCSVDDWSRCATCVSFLATHVNNWCPRAKLARIALADCDIEYAFDTKTTLDEDEVILWQWTTEPVEEPLGILRR